MSTRKYVRGMIRREAERKKIKPSKWVNREFDRIQIKKYGVEQREINKAKGTNKKSTWRPRIAFAIEKAKERRERGQKRRIKSS